LNWLRNITPQKRGNEYLSLQYFDWKKIEAASLMLQNKCRLSDYGLCYRLCQNALQLKDPCFTPHDGFSTAGNSMDAVTLRKQIIMNVLMYLYGGRTFDQTEINGCGQFTQRNYSVRKHAYFCDLLVEEASNTRRSMNAITKHRKIIPDHFSTLE
uniref:Uncharacterized protein n=1 Tax=Romanomermis culicivorax TaxID=13658 RepID=A0A915IPP7_ROMCU